MECLSKELKTTSKRYFQFTAIDEYTRLRYLYFCEEKLTFETAKFVDRLTRYLKCKAKKHSHI